MDPAYSLDMPAVRRGFDRAASSFDSADFVHAAMRAGLFARLEPIVIETKLVVDLGCATGAAIPGLAKRFRGARVVGVDLSRNMLLRSAARRGWFSRSAFVQADARSLPFADHSVDVVFSNLLLPWIDEPAGLAGEVARVLRDGGLFLFSTLGPDSLLELRRAWAAADDSAHVNHFPDMHDVGDALVRGGLRDPVLDIDRLEVTYTGANALFTDLRSVGARNSLSGRRRSLTGRAGVEAMRRQLESAAGGPELRLDLELVYGHCWGSGMRPAEGLVHIDPAAIPIRRQ